MQPPKTPDTVKRVRLDLQHCISSLTLISALASAGAIAADKRPSNAEIYFRLQNPCPVTGKSAGACKGYVVDRVIPTLCGGKDETSNMQWLTLAQAKEKARWEKIGCRKGRKLVLPGQNPPVTEAHALGDPVEPVIAEPLPP